MRRSFLLAPLVCLVAGCAGAGAARAPEGTSVAIVWNRTDEPRRVCEALSGRKEFFNILGCARWDDESSASAGASSAPARPAAANVRVCTIYAPEPRDERDAQRFATLGHELMHCFDGNWHDRHGNKR